MSYRSIGWRAVTRSKKDGYVWLSSRIVRESKDAESIVAQWQERHPRGVADVLEYATEQVFALGVPPCDGRKPE